MASRRFAPYLWVLLSLFCFRVLIQLVQWRFELPFLPRFEAWHSAVVPYPVLLLIQLGIIACFAKIAFQISTSSIEASRRSGDLWFWFGLAYLGAMLARLVLGLTVLSSHFWFSNPLPTAFHLVLASFVVLVGLSYRRARAARGAEPEAG